MKFGEEALRLLQVCTYKPWTCRDCYGLSGGICAIILNASGIYLTKADGLVVDHDVKEAVHLAGTFTRAKNRTCRCWTVDAVQHLRVQILARMNMFHIQASCIFHDIGIAHPGWGKEQQRNAHCVKGCVRLFFALHLVPDVQCQLQLIYTLTSSTSNHMWWHKKVSVCGYFTFRRALGI